jgi:hypothetical protein
MRQGTTRLTQVVQVRQFRFRALVTLDLSEPHAGSLHPSVRRYPSHTRSLMVHARPLRADIGPARYFPAEIWRDDEQPLEPGCPAVVTVRVTGNRADGYLSAGQQFTLWSGSDIGHGTVFRRVFTDYGPS